MTNIIYFQTNEEVAGALKNYILRDDINVLHAKEKEEALKLVKENEVLLLLIDVNILNEELESFLKKVRKHSNKIIIFVCLGEADVLFIEKLINEFEVRKVYMSPINPNIVTEDMENIVSRLEKTEEAEEKDDTFEKEIEEIKITLGELTKKLKKQQHSYTKLLEFTSCFEEAVESTVDDEDTKARLAFSKDIYTSLIRMQTTGVFDIEKFSTDVENDIRTIKKGKCEIEIKEVKSCLFGGLSKPLVQKIRFCIYLVARLYAEFFDKITLYVDSRFLTTKSAEFFIEISYETKLTGDKLQRFSEYEKMAVGIIEKMSDDMRKNDEGTRITYYCSFPVSNE